LGIIVLAVLASQAIDLPSPSPVWRTGSFAVDIETGEVVLDSRSDELFRPASTVKLVTTLLALETLGPGYIYETTIAADTSTGALYVIGAGSPLLEEDDIGRAAVETAGSIDPSREWRVIYDTGCFEESVHLPGWERPDWGRTYCPPVEALSFGGNLVEIVVSSVGGPVRVLQWPELPGVDVTAGIGTGASDNVTTSVSGWETGEGSITLSGWIRAGSTRSLWIPVPGASAEFSRLFASNLAEQGIRVSTVEEGQAPDGPGLLTASVIRSRPLWQILAEMNKWSLNGVAELVLRTASLSEYGEPAGTASGCEMAGAMLRGLVPEARGIQLADGSGLSRLDLLSPRCLAAVLSAGAGSVEWGPEFVASLSVNGVDGTLGTRLSDLPPGSFRGKTGSLNDTSALAGVLVTGSGRRLAVALMAEVDPGQVYAARNWQDEVVRALYAGI
jgi:D-alanyl-D-alanine carboxypeptidase/D-alanyl-D-alanine-endopeptidase (penicillin-binding protein 4)